MSGAPSPDPVSIRALALVLALILGQRIPELLLSARNDRRLKARGAREYGRGHFPWLVLLHVLFPVGLVAEVLGLGTRPGPLWPLWLGVWLAAQALRLSAIRALGEYWSVRVWVVPGAPLVRRGPYRRLRHPSYIAVTAELLAVPLLLGAWRTAIAVTALNLVVLRARIRAENAALGEASGRGEGSGLARGDAPQGR